MKNKTNIVAWVVFALLCTIIGLYPLVYFFIEGKFGLLASKSDEILNHTLWNIGFYGHISFGGLALLIGWTQFSKKLRSQNINLHRNIGKIYSIAALLSGICGFGIALKATGGVIATMGFISLALIWVYTTLKAYYAVRKGDIKLHQGFMIYSYAACFSAVTLRVWLPLLTIGLGSFIVAYKVVAWLCWIPNIVFAYFWIKRKGLILG